MKNRVIHDGSKYNPDCYFVIYTQGGRLMAELFTRHTGDYMGARFMYDGDDLEGYIEGRGYRNMCWDLRFAMDAFLLESDWRQTAKGTLVQ